jgi:hypothetical protein
MGAADILRELVIANGHISVRDPERSDRFFLSGSRSPEHLVLDDIIEYALVAKAVGATALAWSQPGPPATVGANRGQGFSARRKCGEHRDHGVEAVGFDGSCTT